MRSTQQNTGIKKTPYLSLYWHFGLNIIYSDFLEYDILQ